MKRIVDIVARLRAPDGCPWDQAQDSHSMKAYVVEEAYEVVEAIEAGDPELLCEELGDLLFQIVFLAQLGREAGHFDLEDVVNRISDKMERRHPHVFAGVTMSRAEISANWEAEKAREKAARGPVKAGLFAGIPASLPALHKARRIGAKMAAFGFDWPDVRGPWDKLVEEIGELKEAMDSGDLDHTREELGDVLFVLVSLGRKLKLDAEDALRRTLTKATRRFDYVHRTIAASGGTLAEADLDTMEAAWQAAKAHESR